ncbi:MAG TPA: hypothetical protein VJK48_02950 [Chlamydiales bacterium]|nr:hypothetical protein [Chlamydiales bacterium]
MNRQWNHDLYTESGSRIGKMTRRRLEFEADEVVAEAAKVKHFGDAGSFKFNGCPTRSEPILQSRAVYQNSNHRKKYFTTEIETTEAAKRGNFFEVCKNPFCHSVVLISVVYFLYVILKIFLMVSTL